MLLKFTRFNFKANAHVILLYVKHAGFAQLVEKIENILKKDEGNSLLSNTELPWPFRLIFFFIFLLLFFFYVQYSKFFYF